MGRGTKIFVAISAVVALFFLTLAFFASQPSANVAAAQPAKPVPPTSAQQKQAARCGKLLSGVNPVLWTHMQQHNDFVAVVTGNGFTASSFDDRKALIADMLCYYSDGRMNGAVKSIVFLDPHTHQEIGSWDEGLGAKFDR